MDTAATIIFKSQVARCLFEGSYYLSAALILLGNGKPSEGNVLLRQRCSRAPRIQDGMYSILGRDPDCYPRT